MQHSHVRGVMIPPNVGQQKGIEYRNILSVLRFPLLFTILAVLDIIIALANIIIIVRFVDCLLYIFYISREYTAGEIG